MDFPPKTGFPKLQVAHIGVSVSSGVRARRMVMAINFKIHGKRDWTYPTGILQTFSIIIWGPYDIISDYGETWTEAPIFSSFNLRTSSYSADAVMSE